MYNTYHLAADFFNYSSNRSPSYRLSYTFACLSGFISIQWFAHKRKYTNAVGIKFLSPKAWIYTWKMYKSHWIPRISLLFMTKFSIVSLWRQQGKYSRRFYSSHLCLMQIIDVKLYILIKLKPYKKCHWNTKFDTFLLNRLILCMRKNKNVYYDTTVEKSKENVSLYNRFDKEIAKL